MKRLEVPITVDASGDGTGYTTENVHGFIRGIRYVKTDYADTVDFVITADVAGTPILTVSNVTASTSWHPRQATHAVDGTASLYAAAGEPVETAIPFAGDRVKIVVDEAGNATSGTFHIWVG